MEEYQEQTFRKVDRIEDVEIHNYYLSAKIGRTNYGFYDISAVYSISQRSAEQAYEFSWSTSFRDMNF